MNLECGRKILRVKVGRSRAAVANALRLLDLHPQVQIWLAQNLVSVGHAKVLLALKATGRTIARCGNSFAAQRHGAFHRANGCASAWHWTRTSKSEACCL